MVEHNFGEGRRRAAGFIRNSSANQVHTQLSIAAQKNEIEKFARANGLEIVGWYVNGGDDDAEDDASEGSGFLPAREALLADARSPERGFDTVLVWKFSRLSREIMEFRMIVSVLKESGVTVTSVTETVGSSSTDSLLGSVIRAVEEFERKRHREATRRGIAAARLRRQGPGWLTQICEHEGHRRKTVALTCLSGD